MKSMNIQNFTYAEALRNTISNRIIGNCFLDSWDKPYNEILFFLLSQIETISLH